MFNRPRLLFTDNIFPTAIGKWRVTEIFDLIRHFDVDFYSPYRPPGFPTHLQLLENLFPLRMYDCLIFDPLHNVALNSINSLKNDEFVSEVDGASFNGICGGKGYLLRLRKFRTDDAILGSCAQYNVIYHMFYDTFHAFTRYFPESPLGKQCVRLYPSGWLQLHTLPGMRFAGCSAVIISQAKVWRNVRFDGCKPIFIHEAAELSLEDTDVASPYSDSLIVCKTFGAPYLAHADVICEKEFTTSGPLRVSFTTLGKAEEKGDFVFAEIVKRYIELFADDEVEFYAIGSVQPILPQTVRRTGILSQFELDVFYQTKIDVHMNCQTGKTLHGWPLGAEAMLAGCLLMTTDYHNDNMENDFHFDSDNEIILYRGDKHGEVDFFVQQLHQVHVDRERLKRIARAGQRRAYQLFSYEKMLAPVIQCLHVTALRNGFSSARRALRFKSFDITAQKPGYPLLSRLGGCRDFQLPSSEIVPTQTTDECRLFLSSAIESLSGKSQPTFIEIGCMGGATLLYCYQNTRSLPFKIRFIGIDPFDSTEYFNGRTAIETPPAVVVNTRQFLRGCYEKLVSIVSRLKDDNVRIIRNTSFGAAAEILVESVDVLYIDGDHSTMCVYTDLRMYYPKMKKGGIIFGNCEDWPSVQKGISLFQAETNNLLIERIALSCKSKLFKIVKQ
jgi:hypothetical protein